MQAHPIPWPLPPEDRAASPYTGWSRAHWEATADGLLAAVDRHASPGRGLILRPGRHSWSGARSDGLEGYARTFLLAAFRIAGAAGDDPHGILQQYADGLAAGTRTPGRDDAESWPLPAECGQAWVEAASIALGLRLTKPWLWNRLDDDVRQRASAWLSGVLGEPRSTTTGGSSLSPSAVFSPTRAYRRRPRAPRSSAAWSGSKGGT